mmetsp:Transcript_9660/g.21422  ORF Transcript_9660/g.21422 Transcript_9660/m.21422 type:complete len:211 (-) Transcript_9660:307-939(-)
MCRMFISCRYCSRLRDSIRPPLMALCRAEITRCTVQATDTANPLMVYTMAGRHHLRYSTGTACSKGGSRYFSQGRWTVPAMALPRAMVLANSSFSAAITAMQPAVMPVNAFETRSGSTTLRKSRDLRLSSSVLEICSTSATPSWSSSFWSSFSFSSTTCLDSSSSIFTHSKVLAYPHMFQASTAAMVVTKEPPKKHSTKPTNVGTSNIGL